MVGERSSDDVAVLVVISVLGVRPWRKAMVLCLWLLHIDVCLVLGEFNAVSIFNCSMYMTDNGPWLGSAI